MTTATIILVLVLAAVVAWTIRTVANGGTGNPPRSHTRDRDFLPPSALLR
jgi:hypothetical protein